MMIILIGLLIGIWGYLIVGNINLSVIELSEKKNSRWLIFFIALAILFEFLYCFFTLYALQYLMDFPTVISIAQYTSVAFLLIIGFWSLLEKVKTPKELSRNIIRRGYWSIVVHPQQIPFWFFWGIILMDKEWLSTSTGSLIGFSLANSIGGLLILICYAFFGSKIIKMLNLNRRVIKNFVGVVCIISAIILIVDMFKA